MDLFFVSLAASAYRGISVRELRGLRDDTVGVLLLAVGSCRAPRSIRTLPQHLVRTGRRPPRRLSVQLGTGRRKSRRIQCHRPDQRVAPTDRHDLGATRTTRSSGAASASISEGRSSVLTMFTQLWRRDSTAVEGPFRDEFLGAQRLEDRALAIAARFTIDPRARARNTLPRFEENARVLAHAHRLLVSDVQERRFLTAASEWLLDNFHLVASQIADAHRNLPQDYYRELPPLAAPEHLGRARIYGIAIELVRHSDGQFERKQLEAFLNSYQRVAPLTIGELWAWPSMLTLALVENLRRLADEILRAREARLAADEYLRDADAEVDTPSAEGVARDAARRLDCSTAAAYSRVRAKGAGTAARGAGATRRTTDDFRRRRARGAPASGRPPGVGGQRRHQSAAVLGDRLARLRRKRESGRARLAARSGRRLWPHGFPQPRSAAPRCGTDRRSERGSAVAVGAEGGGQRATRGRQRIDDRSSGPRWLSPDRSRPLRSRGRGGVSAPVSPARAASGVGVSHDVLPGIDRSRVGVAARRDGGLASRHPRLRRDPGRRPHLALRPCDRPFDCLRSTADGGGDRSSPSGAARSLGWCSRRGADDGDCPDAARQPRGGGDVARASRSAGSRQPGPAYSLCDSQRLCRCRVGHA